MTAISTTPPASTTWTTDIGASASAATWKPQAPVATTMPMREPLRGVQQAFAVCSGCRMSTGGASQAPRCLKKNAEVRDEGAEEREQDAEIRAHEKRVSAPDRVLM